MKKPRKTATMKPTDDQEFDQFWAEYPRKEGTSKKEAAASYRRARKTASAGEILIGLRVYPFSTETKFQPHAATWLNQRRWEQHKDTAPQRVIVAPTPPSRSSWLSRYDHLALPFDRTPAASRARVGTEELFTIDAQQGDD
jgi:hypothetical protein